MPNPKPTAIEVLQRALDHAGAYRFTADILIDALAEEDFIIIRELSHKEALQEAEDYGYDVGTGARSVRNW